MSDEEKPRVLEEANALVQATYAKLEERDRQIAESFDVTELAGLIPRERVARELRNEKGPILLERLSKANEPPRIAITYYHGYGAEADTQGFFHKADWRRVIVNQDGVVSDYWEDMHEADVNPGRSAFERRLEAAKMTEDLKQLVQNNLDK